MSEHVEEREGDLTDFAKRVGIILGAVFACITVLTMLWRWTPMQIRKDVDRLDNRTVLTDANVNRLAQVVELGVVLQSEAPNSPEHNEALKELRKLRRVSVLKNN